MRYCSRCLYPENAKPTIIFDEEGVCSGCRYHESRSKIEVNWEERQNILCQILDEARVAAKKRGNVHDCIIPVGGGKDSTYQVQLIKEVHKMNPLLVTFNHIYNSRVGLANLENLVRTFDCDLVRYTMNAGSVRRNSRYMLETVGDMTWHYHAGIKTLPFQEAVHRNIPLVIWGEHGFAELTGVVSLEDFVEFTKWTRKEHDMRGYEAHDLVGKGDITLQDVAPFIYPSDEEIERVGIRGIYLSNFIPWDAKKQGETVIEECGFKPVTYKRARTFNLYSKLEDHANDVHDYLKYLKFGYGRATDDASMEIRHGRMTREEGIEMVREYDHVEPPSLECYCDFMGISKERFYKIIEPMRDAAIWEKDPDGIWKTKDSVVHHPITECHEKVRVSQSKERTFSPANRQYYYNNDNPPVPCGNDAFDKCDSEFTVL